MSLRKQVSHYSNQLKQLAQRPDALVAALFLAIGLVAITAITHSKKDTDNRSQAFFSSTNAILSLKPASGTVGYNTPQQVDVYANTGGVSVVGFQIEIEFSDKVPSDITFVPQENAGLVLIKQERIGNELRLAWIAPPSSDIYVPFRSNQDVRLGHIAFTGERNGKLSIAFDTNNTAVVEFGKTTNIVSIPGASTYTFGKNSGNDDTSDENGKGKGGGNNGGNNGKGPNK